MSDFERIDLRPTPRATFLQNSVTMEPLDLKTAIQELTLLKEIAVSAGAASSTDDFLAQVIDRCLKSTCSEHGSILVATEKKQQPFTTVVRSQNQSFLREYHISTHITGYVLHHRKPLIIANLADDRRFKSTEEEQRAIRSVVCIPLYSAGKLIGALMMMNKHGGGSFSGEDERLLTVVGSLVGQLLANEKLRAEAEQERMAHHIAQVSAKKLKELNEAKSRFFENVSHELRTPLTLLLGPLEDFIAHSTSDAERHKYVAMRRNGRQLLRMINQLLDVSRIEAGTLRLHASMGDLARFLRIVIEAFESLARQKGIALESKLPDSLYAIFDEEKMEKAVTNLVSNALKFTPEGGRVSVSASIQKDIGATGEMVQIVVCDSGIGISEEDLPRIFERFYQSRGVMERGYGGSGIGLSLAKELVELHGGKISVESKEGKGSAFTVVFPRGNGEPEEQVGEPRPLAARPSPLAELSAVETSLTFDYEGPYSEDRDLDDNARRPLILIVEDHAELRQYMCDTLKEIYRTIASPDGAQGFELASVALPDLIISDVLMPEMSGNELCRRLKNDVRTSHIPVILLTAKADFDSKLVGLECGADDYLTKPFAWEELKIRANNLMDLRRRLRERFSTGDLIEPGEIEFTPMDKVFLRGVWDVVEANMADESFGVEAIGRAVGLSYPQLHRKLKALTGLGPNQFVRIMRLKRARKLIEGSAGTISEIAYSVGFGSPSYFSKCFHRFFGYAPSEIRKV